jgi:hypothetical protein
LLFFCKKGLVGLGEVRWVYVISESDSGLEKTVSVTGEDALVAVLRFERD